VQEGFLVDPTKIVVIVSLPPPTTMKQLHTLFIHTGYYQNFIKRYAKIIVPMEKLLKNDAKFD